MFHHLLKSSFISLESSERLLPFLKMEINHVLPTKVNARILILYAVAINKSSFFH